MALTSQQAYAKGRDVPWGISESAYAGRDSTLAYQYAPQGVPWLALRRTPPGELVIAPYATVMAAQWVPQLALKNLHRLQALNARRTYGFVEAIDYSAERQVEGGILTLVATFMSHHQGMGIVALCNLLHRRQAQRWGMADPHLQAVSALLQEKPPWEISRYQPAPERIPLHVSRRRGRSLSRDVTPAAQANQPTQLLSNGRYSVALRSNGAGWSKLGSLGISRWRDDALRDNYGSFLYIKAQGGHPSADPSWHSLTQHPAAHAQGHYEATFHADRVSFDSRWTGLQAAIHVWVSPEDDIEFRQVELRNLRGTTQSFDVASAFEATLCSAAADEAHPAFSNLFVRAHWQSDMQALVLERKPR
ncbi:MAG: glucoamylase family protein, partial [Rhodoferax sp.]